MKKLIAISVMMALVAGAAFAETSVGGGLEMTMVMGDDPVAVHSNLVGATISLTAESDEGNFGGMLKLALTQILDLEEYGDPLNPDYDFYWNYRAFYNRAFMWWKPIDQVKILFGFDGDGWFNPAGVSAWGYHKGTLEGDVRTGERWGVRGRAILGNWDKFSVGAEIKPIDDLTVNVGIKLPDPNRDAEEFKEVFKHMQLQAGYSVDGIGNFWVTFQTEYAGDAFGISYHTWSLLDGLALEAGFAYKLTSGATDPIGIAVGAEYNSGADWGVQFKTLVTGFDNFVWDYVCFMPWYDFGFMKALFNVEIDNVVNDNADLAVIINPYIVKNVGPGQVGMGFQYDTDSEEWKFAMGMKIGF